MGEEILGTILEWDESTQTGELQDMDGNLYLFNEESFEDLEPETDLEVHFYLNEDSEVEEMRAS